MIVDFEGVSPRIHPSAWIAPNATVIGNVEIGAEASVWYGAVIRGDGGEHVIRIGARTSVQDNCVVHVSDQGPTLIGEEVTIGHGAVLESCEIGRGALVGMNAVVLQQVVIGEQSLIAAGSVVAAGSVIPARSLAAGAPAKVKKEISGASLDWVEGSAAHYVDLSRRYLADAARRRPEGSASE
ncbi:MAG: gamma carbonic anhydrase family protein [Gemmatimonadota bacterium]|jgi:carbonic anhydrase/acetyltransferase-like protein (isoleucine patch superfamily)|nr:gamma carbonic anhydrase family protein [Gemmatimonadota bacterium]